MAPDLQHAADPLAIACTDTVDAVYTAPANLPAFDATHRGDVVRCAFDRSLTASQINSTLTALNYVGPPVQSDVDVYRIAYRTTRVGTAGGLSSALVFMPAQAKRHTDAYVVTGHGTVGLADKCAPSKLDLTNGSSGSDAQVFYLALAGDGWIEIAPDYAGFGYGQTVSGWSLAEDEGHSLLDATRAMKNLVEPMALPNKVAFMGHSQGAHAVLSVQPMIASYGSAQPVIGIAPMGVLWFSNLTWGASISPAAGQNTTDDPAVIAFGMYYFYGHGENYDGAGGGVKMFQASKQAMVQQLLTTGCGADVEAGVTALGTSPSDFYDPAFVTAMQNCMIFGAQCDVEPAKTWLARAIADRPAIDPAGPPILIWHGALDATIAPGRAQCGFDKIEKDLAGATNPTATLTICGDAGATHGTIVRRDIDYVSQWIATRAAGLPDPPGCPGEGPLEPGDGGTLMCATPPPNL
jgi:hypothetical protein